MRRSSQHASAVVLAVLASLWPPCLAAQRTVVTITIDTLSPARIVVPSEALGAGVDGHDSGAVAEIFTPENVRAMREVGLPRLTYRLRTELGIEAWHWNPRGRWSDSSRAQGYWVSDSLADSAITVSYGYALPRRGNTIDNANNAGYSRLDDGDTATFWKSNPYLDQRYTGEGEPTHAQWVVVNLGAVRRVDAIRIRWGEPHATAYRVQWLRGYALEDIGWHPDGRWIDFPSGVERAGKGGDERRRLTPTPVRTRYVRILMTASSHTALAGSTDPRDSLGYAIRELQVGTLDARGALHDLVRHGRARERQSVITVSSTDPWHRAIDRDVDVEQPGLDLVFRSGLTNGLPVMVPVAVLFGVPESAANELRYLEARGYPLARIEMGEEPDGQAVNPEDFGALYVQTARALRAVDTAIALGGPSFQDLEHQRAMTWPEDSAITPWIPRFLSELRRAHRERDFSFVSFEWYPYDEDCGGTATQLALAPMRLASGLALLRDEGLPDSIPRIIAEYGYSPFSVRAEVDIEQPLLDADVLGQFFTLGGRAAYLYGYEPTTLDENIHCRSWGDNALFLADEARHIRYPLARYWGMRMITQQWLEPGDGEHRVVPAESDARTAGGERLVTAYAVHRPDDAWAVMLVNKDPSRAMMARLRLHGASGDSALARPLEVWQLSRAQYRWHAAGPHGRPVRDEPPAHQTLTAGALVALPPYSLTVVRWDATEVRAARPAPR